MSNLYNITEADIQPVRMPASEFAATMRDRQDGAAPAEFEAVATAGIADFHGFLGGKPVAEAAMELCRPHAITFILWLIYSRRPYGGEETRRVMETAYNAAVSWTKGAGTNLLAAEGAQLTAPAAGAQFVAPKAKWDPASSEMV